MVLGGEDGIFEDPVFEKHVERLKGLVAANYPANIGRVTLVGVSGRSNRTTNFAAFHAGEHVTSALTRRDAKGIHLTDRAVGDVSKASRVVVVDEANAPPHEALTVAEQALDQGAAQVDLVLTSRLPDEFTAQLVTGLNVSAIRETLGRVN